MQVLRWGACSCDREKLLWLPEFTSGPHGIARSSPFGQLQEITTGGCRPGSDTRQCNRQDVCTAAPAPASAIRDWRVAPRDRLQIFDWR